MFAVGTEIHLVNRMGKEFAAEGKKVITLTIPAACAPPCSASRRSICAGRWKIWRKQCREPDQSERRREALGRVALDRMLEIQ